MEPAKALGRAEVPQRGGRTTVDLNDLLSCMAASLRESLAGQGIDLVLSLDALGTLRVGERITPVSLAELLRKSVFQPLLDNALEAMPHGGRLMIETRN